MKGLDRKIGSLLNASNAYAIPPYQRNYQWAAERWQALVRDAIQAATCPDGQAPHWLGVVLLTQDSDVRFPGDASTERYTVIDGQQRLVTLMVWLAALAHHAKDAGLPSRLDPSRLAQISVQASDEPQYRIALDGSWREPRYNGILAAGHGPLAAYAYFRWLLWLGQDALLVEEPMKMPKAEPVLEGDRIESQWTAHLQTKAGSGTPRGSVVNVDLLITSTLERLTVYSLIHEPRLDEAEAVIFDTLNGMRTELEPLDHVRNSLFIRIKPGSRAKALYDDHWKVHEKALRAVRQRRMLPGRLFLYDYVIARGEKRRQGTLSANRGAVHFATMTRGLSDEQLETFIRTDLLPAMAAWPVVVRKSDRVEFEGVGCDIPRRCLELMTSIRDLSEGPANPIVLHYLSAFVLGALPAAELEHALAATEAFVVRQLLGERPLSPLRSKMMEILASIDRDTSTRTLVRVLKSSDWVSDEEIRRTARTAKYYENLKARQLGAIFRGIERKLSGSGAMFFSLGKGDDSYGIEHVFPQSTEQWKQDISTWQADGRKMDRLTHTIGNLTVATNRHNSQVGNSRLKTKQAFPLVSGNAAPLALNEGWLKQRKWTEREIEARTDELIKSALAYWRIDSTG